MEHEYEEMLNRIAERNRKNRESANEILKQVKFSDMLTNKQVRKITEIIKEIPYHDFYGNNDKYEVKQFNINVNKDYGYAWVSIITGLKGDSGTYASILCRKYRHFMVGKKGGIKAFNKNSNLVRCTQFELLNKYYTE